MHITMATIWTVFAFLSLVLVILLLKKVDLQSISSRVRVKDIIYAKL